MNRIISLLSVAFLTLTAQGQTAFTAFGTDKATSRHCLYVNPSARDNARRHTFRTVNAALAAAEAQQREAKGDTAWTEIYIAPGVYWIDNPADTTMRRPLPGDHEPYGMKVRLSRTRLIGLAEQPEDVVLAVNRGQTRGADGNFTMLHITGDDVTARNITFGNYCNVDLVYPRNPKLGRPRRSEAIVQAQLVICSGDRYEAVNCRFISRLNLCPFAGARHATFRDCYFECTDDALCSTGLYERCRFTWYSSKPFYNTWGDGAEFRDCDIHCLTRGTQYLTKVSSPIRLYGCRFTSDDPALQFAWTRKPNPKDRCLMEGCSLNGRELVLPPTENIPMPVSFAPFALENRPSLSPGHWTLDAHCPTDLGMYSFAPDTLRPAWLYGEGVDGAEGCFGLIENVRGSRLMYTSLPGERYTAQTVSVRLDPCKGPGQGFGSATGQYLDVCLMFDTATLTGYGLRFVRTPEYDKAVDVMLVAYADGAITPISKAEKCTLFRRGCLLTLHAADGTLTADIVNGEQRQTLSTPVRMLPFGGIQIQHTGSQGASATVISQLRSEYR